VTFFSGEMQIASLDHVMWFHAPFRIDEWLLHVMESPRARGGRAWCAAASSPGTVGSSRRRRRRG
jgi:acyl-CoA thioesterase